jgi:hypothetical protein
MFNKKPDIPLDRGRWAEARETELRTSRLF